MDIRITPPATRKERAAQHKALMALRQQGMQEVGGFAQTFWTFLVGLNYNEAALKSFFNVCLDDPLPQWEMEGLGIMDFWCFVKYLQVRVQWMVPDQSKPLCRDFPTASALPTPTERRRARRRKVESTPEPAPIRELIESTPEPLCSRSSQSSLQSLLRFRSSQSPLQSLLRSRSSQSSLQSPLRSRSSQSVCVCVCGGGGGGGGVPIASAMQWCLFPYSENMGYVSKPRRFLIPKLLS